MLKSALLAAIAAIALVGSANASTYVVSLDTMSTSSTAQNLSGNVDLNSASFVPSAGVTTASIGGQYIPPASVAGSPYLYVQDSGKATFTLTLPTNSFGLTWGSIDTYNTLALTNEAGHTYTITGTALLAALGYPALVGTSNSGIDANVLFTDSLSKIKTAVLTSGSNSFEVARASTSVVPLPPAAILFLSGLLAFFGFAAYKKSRGQI